MGGAVGQATTEMATGSHRSLHSDMYDFLFGKGDESGNHMRPQRGNSGKRIQRNFSRAERLAALAEFYRNTGSKYVDAAKDFLSQHPGL